MTLKKIERENQNENFIANNMNRDLSPDENTKVVKYLLKENLGEYKVNNKGKQLKTIIIGNNQYKYNPEKPISNRLSKRLEAVKKTNDYKANQIRERVGARTVLKHAIKKKSSNNRRKKRL